MVTPWPTCAPSAIAHPINAAEVSLEPAGPDDWFHWLTAGSMAFKVHPDTARAFAAEKAAKYERLAAGLRAFAGEPGVCERPARRWMWACNDTAGIILGDSHAARAQRARWRQLRNDVCAAVPRLVQS